MFLCHEDEIRPSLTFTSYTNSEAGVCSQTSHRDKAVIVPVCDSSIWKIQFFCYMCVLLGGTWPHMLRMFCRID